jgi:hypothetical protein
VTAAPACAGELDQATDGFCWRPGRDLRPLAYRHAEDVGWHQGARQMLAGQRAVIERVRAHYPERGAQTAAHSSAALIGCHRVSVPPQSKITASTATAPDAARPDQP